MKNITIITGPRYSGKSFLAKQLILLYNKSQWFEHSIFYEESIYFKVARDLKKDTEVVVIDEVTIPQIIDESFLKFKSLRITPLGEEAFKRVAPHYILVLAEDQNVSFIAGSVISRCNIITCSHVEGIFTYIKTEI